jgi:hypothetical protein
MAKHSRDSRVLSSKSQVVSALGGIKAVAALTGADYGAVENWKRASNFPPRYFLVMWLELARLGYCVSPRLWGQRELSARKEALLVDVVRRAMAA